MGAEGNDTTWGTAEERKNNTNWEFDCRGWEQTLSFAPGNSAEGMGEVMVSSEEVCDEPGGTSMAGYRDPGITHVLF